MAVLLCSRSESAQEWAKAFAALNAFELRVWPNAGDLSEIDYAIAAHPEEGVLAQCSNLKAIHSLWAGIEHLTNDPSLPKNVPIIRMIDPGLTQGMVEYVFGHVMRYHLLTHIFQAGQARHDWAPMDPPLAQERTIGMLGLGVLGGTIAGKLSDFGFNMLGWSRSPKEIKGVDCLHGENGLIELLSRSSILINLLPNTPATTKLLNAENLAQLPTGACIVNAGRGQLIDDDALLAALDTGQIGGASLDVFWEEPLPKDHPYWSHDKVLVTPHIASVTRISTGAATVVKNLRHLMAGGAIDVIDGVMDPGAGY
ncbi:2-hydroxyacid dehydrogenase [Aestuariispira insulae]|uniref:Glyoxylate/hydroxypyruvate reductase A n=1 Tax=Aestuariispira insulae TaxID=1461337 RepID=A0A3D9H9K3_9PROT|nr:glyoxylate/hydroxypyruvate reductase A [Aestuariispira insulae]RED46180.1 glyoxylate/hydroxypyruvate reductase A [Aestuariispira insulae]